MKKAYPTLFVKDNGRIRTWKATVISGVTDLRTHFARIEMKHGLLGMKITTKPRLVMEGKNLGKANETTPFEQACLDVESDMRGMQNKGYRSFEDLNIEVVKLTDEDMIKLDGFKNGLAYRNITDGHLMTKKQVIDYLQLTLPDIKVDSHDRIKPMILHHLRLPTYAKGTTQFTKSKVIKFPAFVQPKKDGVCSASDRITGLTTREGKESLVKGGLPWNEICPQLYRAVQTLNWDKPLHGEVFKYGYTLGQITDACKKIYPLSGLLEIHIFDVIDLDLNQTERINELELVGRQVDMLNLGDWLKIVPTYTVQDWDELLVMEQKFLEQGDEGIVVRVPTGKYQPGVRSSEVLKLVRFDSSEVEIVDVEPMENEPSHGLFVCRVYKKDLPDEARVVFGSSAYKDFNVTPSHFNHQQRIELLMNRHDYIGKQLTIEHRGYTAYGIPRIATAKTIKYN